MLIHYTVWKNRCMAKKEGTNTPKFTVLLYVSNFSPYMQKHLDDLINPRASLCHCPKLIDEWTTRKTTLKLAYNYIPA